MLDNIAQRWTDLIQSTRNRWRWLGNLLSILAFIFLILLLVYSGYQIKEIEWDTYWKALVITFFISIFSQSLQFLVWVRILSVFKRIDLKDFNIYARFLMMKRLPGGIWQWVGRSSLYSDQIDIPGKTVITASFLEWLILILCGAALLIAGLPNVHWAIRTSSSIPLLSIGAFIAFRWQKSSSSDLKRFFESALWIFLYLLSWALGGLMIFLLGTSTGSTNLSLFDSIWIWSTAGTISFLIVFIPAGLGIREITLTWLLSPYLAPSQAVIVSVLMRLILIIADTIWGMIGFSSTPVKTWLARMRK